MISQLESFIRRVLNEYENSSSYSGTTQDEDYLRAMEELEAFVRGDQVPPASPHKESTPAYLHADYQALEVAPGAPFTEVAAAYKRLAHRYHPDRWSSVSEEKLRLATEIFTRISSSFSRIKDYETRR
ncbi:MAG: J domain-containing protein [Spirochaetaceae bacterium]|nr:MAG: J domain-containing protein [Spirochaetaceae bacterium]